MSKIDSKNYSSLTRLLPCFNWISQYQRLNLNNDLFAGLLTAFLFIPQAMAYAMLAGLPVQMGLYASLLPPLIYALFGTSKVLSVGPVSIAAIMVASAISSPLIQSYGSPVESAIILAIEGGIALMLMASLRMGGLVNFISHPVLSGFTSAAAILIIVSQIPNLLGNISPLDCGLSVECINGYVSELNLSTMAVGLSCLIFLILMGKPLTKMLSKMQLNPLLISSLNKSAPLIAIIISTAAVSYFHLSSDANVPIVGQIPLGLPSLNFSFLSFSSTLWQELLPSAIFISLISYVESVAIAKVAANLTSDKINPNQELVALGMANFGSAISGGMPVAGGFSRTMVNYSAGAKTQLATIVTVFILTISVLYLSQLFAEIPKAALAAIILVAIFPLIKLKEIFLIWRIDIADAISLLITFTGVIFWGIEQGIALGVVFTFISYFRKSSRPHIAVIGRIQNTEQFRNVKRHNVEIWDNLSIIRIDENITFSNYLYILDFIEEQLRINKPEHLILVFSSVSYIDTTALHSLESFTNDLRDKGITLNLAEVKGPVMDILNKTSFVDNLSPGKIYFHISDAVIDLS